MLNLKYVNMATTNQFDLGERETTLSGLHKVVLRACPAHKNY